MIYFFTTVCLLAMLILLLARKKGFVSPSVLWCGSFFFALTAAWMGQSQWGGVELSSTMALLLILSVAVFIFISLLMEKTLIHEISCGADVRTLKQNLPVLSLSTIGIICLFALFTCSIYFSDVHEIVKDSVEENADVFTIIEAYRNYSIGLMKGNVEEVGKISTFSSICFRALEVVAVVILANFIFLDRKEKRMSWKRYSFCMALIVAVLFFPTGSRSPLVHLIIAGFVLVGLYLKLTGKKLSLRFAMRAFLLIILVLGLFALLSVLRGESMRLGIVGYISFFLGSGIASFNQVFDSASLAMMPVPFTGVMNLVNKLGGEIEAPEQGLWISYEGYDSNVFTAFSSYYAHFGLAGVIAYCVALAVIVSLVYTKALNSRSLVWVSVYAFFGFVIFDAIRSDALGGLLGVPLIEYVFFLIVIPAALFRIEGMTQTGRKKSRTQGVKTLN